MTQQQLDEIVTLAHRYRVACEEAQAFMTLPWLNPKNRHDIAYGYAIDAKRAYDALVERIMKAQG